MERLLRLSLVLLFITTFGCAGEDCTSPPVSYLFEFVDKDSGENLFANGTFDAKQAVTVTDLDTNKIVETSYMNTENLNRLRINSIGFESGTFNYSITIQGKSIFVLHVSVDRVTEKGCDFSRINSFEIKNSDSKLDTTTGTYKILINTK